MKIAAAMGLGSTEVTESAFGPSQLPRSMLGMPASSPTSSIGHATMSWSMSAQRGPLGRNRRRGLLSDGPGAELFLGRDRRDQHHRRDSPHPRCPGLHGMVSEGYSLRGRKALSLSSSRLRGEVWTRVIASGDVNLETSSWTPTGCAVDSQMAAVYSQKRTTPAGLSLCRPWTARCS